MLTAVVALALPATLSATNPAAPDPVNNPQSPLMLAGPWVPADTHRIDFSKLPHVPSQCAIVSDVRLPGKHGRPEDSDKTHKYNDGVNQHNYLAYCDGKYWAMWSDGPAVEDRVGQRVKFATSPDGLHWNTPRYLTPIPPNSGPDSPYYNTRTKKGFRYISRGFWEREGELLALASLDEAAGFFGESLELRGFRYNRQNDSWDDIGVIFGNTINNFPPKKIATGEWMMCRRTWDYRKTGSHFMVGGHKKIDEWESFPVSGSNGQLAAEEPLWYTLPGDKNLVGLFRDNNFSKFLFRSFSVDNGRTWSTPVRTNFPDATSKLFGLRLTNGQYALVSNANPKKRDPLVLSLSPDGLVYNRMYYLAGGRHVDYPSAMEHDGHLLVTFSSGKQTVEVLKIRLSDLNGLQMPTSLELPPETKAEKSEKPKAKTAK